MMMLDEIFVDVCRKGLKINTEVTCFRGYADQEAATKAFIRHQHFLYIQAVEIVALHDS